MFKHYGSITVLAVAGVGFSGLSWANTGSSGSSVVLEEALAESLQTPFLFPVEGVTVQAGFSTTHDFLIDTTAFIDTPAGLRLQLAGNMANAAGSRAGLTKTGGGTLVLAGQNTYGGNTRVTAGTLRLEGASAAGDGLRSVELFSGSTLEYAPGTQVNNMLQLWHPQDEAGNKPAAGQQAAGYTVRLSVPAGMATQAGSIAEAPGAAVNLVKDGAGSLVLAGFTHAPVAARVQQGTLAVQAFFGGAIAVEDGATLAGTGTVGRLRVQHGGVLSPGMDGLTAGGADAPALPATLSVTGNLELDPGSQLRLNVWPDGTADKVQVLGIARLGGTLQALAADGDWAPDTLYTVVQAQDGLEGTEFAAATSNLAYLTPGLHYDASAAYLTLTRNDRPLDDVLDDPGEGSVGDIIDDAVSEPATPPGDVADTTPAVPPVKPPTPTEPADVAVADPVVPEAVVAAPAEPETVLYNTLVTLTAPQAADTLRTLDGSWQASVQSRLLSDLRYLRELSLQEWRQAPATLNAGARAWAASYGARAGRDGRGDTHGDSRDLSGLALGATWSLPRAHADAPRVNLGLVAGAEHSRMQRQGTQASASVRSWQAGVGADLQWKALGFTMGVIRSWHHMDTRRLVQLSLLPAQLLSDARRIISDQGVAELRLRVQAHTAFIAEAFGRASWVRTRMQAGEERGGLSALRFQESSQQVRLAELGLRAQRTWPLAQGHMLLWGEAAWQHAGGNLTPETRARFRDSTQPRYFSSQGQPVARQAVNLRLAAQWQVSEALALNLQYMGQLAKNQRDHGAQLNLAWQF